MSTLPSIFHVFFMFFVFFVWPAQAEQVSDAFRSTDYPLPRFASMAVNEAHVRAGPGRKFPIKWVLIKKRLPVEIILEYDAWRKIRDHEGGEGWVHQSLLSGKRTGIISSDEVIPIQRRPEEDARVLAQIEPGVVVGIEECQETRCRINASGYKGWIGRQSIWGVYEDEILN